jgi:hypothetical protein
MSHNPITDIVPFVKHCVYETDLGILESRELAILLSPECYLEGEYEITDDDASDDKVVLGWQLVKVGEHVGKRSRVWGDRWELVEDPNIVVWVMNESQYENVGICEMSVVSNTQDNLEKFLRDFKSILGTVEWGIEAEDTVSVWC